MAWSDEPWVVEGAAVRVSIVGQDDGSDEERAFWTGEAVTGDQQQPDQRGRCHTGAAVLP